jgi:aerobic carbon-monoxide dehydrogenase large subunit
MYVGQPVRRVEDERFLTGRGRYVDDLDLPGAAHAVFLRSTHAHAAIRNIDSKAAGQMPGVLAVLTGKEWIADGGGTLPVICDVPFSDGRPMGEAMRPVFATGRARHVGDTLAVVLAETRDQAMDAVDAIVVDFEPLPVAASTDAALAPDAPQLHENVPGNLCFDWQAGDKDAVERALSQSAHRLELTVQNNRIFHLPMEPRAVAAQYDAADERYTLWTSSQIPHLIRNFLAEHSLKVPATQIRVIAPDVGGGFGQKSIHYPKSLPSSGRHGGLGGRCAGSQRGRTPFWSTHTPAIRLRPCAWASIQMAGSPHSMSILSAILAHISPPSPRRYHRPSAVRCSRSVTRF